jgi:serine/threonine protein kinase
MQVESGSVIAGRFEVVKRIGAGGMGMVFKAVDRELNNDVVALKLLLPHLAQDEQVFKRFLNEVLVARSLSHPNIVRIHDIGKAEEGYYYISMEYVDGFSLKERIGSERDSGAESPTSLNFTPLTFEEAVQILADIASGVSYAHSRGIIHRDLKPGNVLISKRGEVKLADFGTARMMGLNTSLTQTGQVIGTPDYMSPEQIRGEQLEPTCDVYSLGIIAYELVTGCKPYSADSAVAVAFKHLSEPIPPFPEHLPRWYRELVEKATAKDKAQRFQDGLEFFAELQKHLPSVLRGTRFFGTPALTETGQFELGEEKKSGSSGTEWRLTDDTHSPASLAPTARRGNSWILPAVLLLIVGGGGYVFFEYRDAMLPLSAEKKPLEVPPLETDEIAELLLKTEPTPSAKPLATPEPTQEPAPVATAEPLVKPTPVATAEEIAAEATATPEPEPTPLPTSPPTPVPTAVPVTAELRLQVEGSEVSELSQRDLAVAKWSVLIKGIKPGDAQGITVNLVNNDRGSLVSRLRKGGVSSVADGVKIDGRFEGPTRMLIGGSYRIDIIRSGEVLALRRFSVEESQPVITQKTPAPVVEQVAESLQEEPLATQEAAVTRSYRGTIELSGADGQSRRGISLELSFKGLEISGVATIEGFGTLSVTGKELMRGYELLLRGQTIQLRLTSGKGSGALRGSFLVAGEPIRGAWQVEQN